MGLTNMKPRELNSSIIHTKVKVSVCDSNGVVTGDYVQVDDNPTQITEVETVVEREGALARSGLTLDMSSYVYQSDEPVVSDLSDILGSIDEEIEKIVIR